MMPKNNKTWSSWNFIKSEKANTNFTLTYWMNNLQKLETMNSQSKLKDLQGINNTFFCGAYHGYGFHEDGIQSAVYISKMLVIDIPWKRDNNFYKRLLY